MRSVGPWTITFGAFNDTGFISSGTYTYDGTSQTPTVDNGTMTSFYNLGKDVTHCQSKGVKIVMSLGGDHSSPYSFGPGDGEFYANLWYNQFLGGTHPVRPLGPGVQLDGFELDIEKPGYEAEMTIFVTTLRKLCPKCVLAAVPQCILTYGTDGLDQNVGLTINATNGKGILDYVIIQYYNNPPCSYPFGFNFKSWKPLFNGPLYIGLAGDWTSAINGGFMEMPQLQAVYDMVKDDPQFAGWSVYDVSSSTPPAKYWNVENYANPSTSNYSQVLSGILQGTPAWTGVQLPPQGPVAQDGLNTTYRCASTWIWANTQCSLEDCYDAVAKGGDPEKVCGGNTQCNQMVVKC
ncbi:glycoside hydrolase superfamily [Chytriomyces sp. MP71]|nr:glycoside hydrolase superfamily [Chytriomyces sp. MP71]